MKDLIEFNKNVTKLNKDIFKYEDDNNLYYLNAGQLILRLDYNELDDDELRIAKFQNKVTKGVEFPSHKGTRKVDKSTITHNKNDQGTIIDKNVNLHSIYQVTNGLGYFTSFNDERLAKNYVNAINEKVFEMAEIKLNEPVSLIKSK